MEAGPSFVPLLKNDTLTEDLTIETNHGVTSLTELSFDIYSFTTISSICLTFCATIVLFAHTYLLLVGSYSLMYEIGRYSSLFLYYLPFIESKFS